MSIITEKKTEVNNLIDQVKIGVFENNSGKTHEEEFETKINNITDYNHPEFAGGMTYEFNPLRHFTSSTI